MLTSLMNHYQICPCPEEILIPAMIDILLGPGKEGTCTLKSPRKELKPNINKTG